MKIKYTCEGKEVVFHTDIPLKQLSCPICEEKVENCEGYKKAQ